MANLENIKKRADDISFVDDFNKRCVDSFYFISLDNTKCDGETTLYLDDNGRLLLNDDQIALSEGFSYILIRDRRDAQKVANWLSKDFPNVRVEQWWLSGLDADKDLFLIELWPVDWPFGFPIYLNQHCWYKVESLVNRVPAVLNPTFKGHLFEDSEDNVLRNVPLFAPTDNGYWVVYSGKECQPLRNCSELATRRAIDFGEISNTPSLRFLDKAEAEQYQKDITAYWAETHPEWSRVGYVNNIGFATIRPEPKEGLDAQYVKLPEVVLFNKVYTSAVLYTANNAQYQRFVDKYEDKKYRGHLFESKIDEDYSNLGITDETEFAAGEKTIAQMAEEAGANVIFKPIDDNWFVIDNNLDTIGYSIEGDHIDFNNNCTNSSDSRYLIFRTRSDAEAFIKENCKDSNLARSCVVEKIWYNPADSWPLLFIEAKVGSIPVYFMSHSDWDDEQFWLKLKNRNSSLISFKNVFKGHLFEDVTKKDYLADKNIRDTLNKNIATYINELSEEMKKELLGDYELDEILSVIDNNLCNCNGARSLLTLSRCPTLELLVAHGKINSTETPVNWGSSIYFDTDAETLCEKFKVNDYDINIVQHLSEGGKLFRMHLRINDVECYSYFTWLAYIDGGTNSRNHYNEMIRMIKWYLDNDFVYNYRKYRGHLFEDLDTFTDNDAREYITKYFSYTHDDLYDIKNNARAWLSIAADQENTLVFDSHISPKLSGWLSFESVEDAKKAYDHWKAIGFIKGNNIDFYRSTEQTRNGLKVNIAGIECVLQGYGNTWEVKQILNLGYGVGEYTAHRYRGHLFEGKKDSALFRDKFGRIIKK